MLAVGQDSLPATTWHNFSELILNKIASLGLKLRVLGDVDDVLHLFLVDAKVVVHVSLVANSLQPVHVQVKVEVARDDWYFLEDL